MTQTEWTSRQPPQESWKRDRHPGDPPVAGTHPCIRTAATENPAASVVPSTAPRSSFRTCPAFAAGFVFVRIDGAARHTADPAREVGATRRRRWGTPALLKHRRGPWPGLWGRVEEPGAGAETARAEGAS